MVILAAGVNHFFQPGLSRFHKSSNIIAATVIATAYLRSTNTFWTRDGTDSISALDWQR